MAKRDSVGNQAQNPLRREDAAPPPPGAGEELPPPLAAGVREDPMALPPGVDELLGKVKELSGQVVELVRRIDAIEGPRKAREAEPYPCPRCGSTKTPIRGGVHASHAGIKRYRECRECAWTFSTIKTAGGEREA